MHEINASAFGNRIDVLAVSRAEIIAVEIKSEKDKLDRLKDQVAAMSGCAHHAIAALHAKFLVERETSSHTSEYERDGKHYLRAHPAGAPFGKTWIYPEKKRGAYSDGLWREPGVTLQQPLPPGAIHMLWAPELRNMCHRFGVSAGRNPVMETMINALRWRLTGQELTHGICAALRSRRCIEADAPIEWTEGGGTNTLNFAPGLAQTGGGL